MTVKAIAGVTGFFIPASTGKWKCKVEFSPTVAWSGGVVMYVDDLDPGILSATLKIAIEGAVKDFMENNGVTFGLGDSVRALIPTF